MHDRVLHYSNRQTRTHSFKTITQQFTIWIHTSISRRTRRTQTKYEGPPFSSQEDKIGKNEESSQKDNFAEG